MDRKWIVRYEGWNKDEHPLREALCTLGNGVFATRGAFEEVPDNDYNYPGTYLAGGYNRMKSHVKDEIVENEDLVNWPNWLYLTFRINGGEWLDLEKADILEHITSLNIREGILERKIRFRDEDNYETSIISRRIVSMDDYHVGAIEWTLIPENWSGTATIRSGIDGNVINNNVARYRDLNQDHIEVLEKGSFNGNGIYLISRSKQSKILMTQAARTDIYVNNRKADIKPELFQNGGFVSSDISFECSKLQPVRIEKLASLFTSRDFAISDPLTEARKKTQRLKCFADIAEKQKMVWSQIWSYNDIVLESSNTDQLILRLHIFHLYQTVSKNSIDYDIGVPARGWHGEAYRGHIFWDELYILPFINLHNPQLSRSLLLYRFRRLPEAYHSAKEAGYRGAMYPWQSGSNGREETQVIHLNPKSGRWIPDNTRFQRHINAAIPYNVWHYYQSTGDMDFLETYGAEIITATALFWSSIATWNPKRDRYEIMGVMGPDEYHTKYPGSNSQGLNNNAYTNVMAAWVMQKALDVCGLMDGHCIEKLSEKVGFNEEDIEKWRDMTRKMYVPFYEGKIIEQFEGFCNLKDLDWEKYRKKYGNIMRLDRILESEDDSPNNYKAVKQADVLMLFYLFSREELESIFGNLGYSFTPEMIPENISYYQGVTSHGSTLSQVIHAWVYSRSDRDRSWKKFRQALMSDFRDIQGGTTHEGIHLGAMAGTIDLVQRCYSGLEIRDDVLWLNPCLPEDISSVSFHVRYRSHWIKLFINHKKLKIEFDKGFAEPVRIGVKGRKYRFETDDKKEFTL